MAMALSPVFELSTQKVFAASKARTRRHPRTFNKNRPHFSGPSQSGLPAAWGKLGSAHHRPNLSPHISGMTPPPSRPCPFCQLDPNRILAEDELTVVYRDGFPVSLGHTVIIPRRHFATLFEATEAEQAALLKALAQARDIIDRHHQPDGYNIGINHGQAGGQSVPHLHIHLIPRYRGDKEDPRGGVRWVLPDKAKYWS
jgi:diadenosine tetraphosphate (Ap4A) HIT family hydrolase